MLGYALVVKELEQVGEDDIGFGLFDVPCAGLLCDPADLFCGQHGALALAADARHFREQIVLARMDEHAPGCDVAYISFPGYGPAKRRARRFRNCAAHLLPQLFDKWPADEIGKPAEAL